MAVKRTVKPPAKKTSPAKAKSSPKPAPEEAIAKQILDAITGGHLDGYLTQIDDALTERSNAKIEARVAAEKPASASGGKTVAPPPKKPAASKGAATVTPVKDKVYLVSSAFKKLAGSEVSFVRHKDGDVAKSVVAMVTDKPGFPVGKRVVIPTNALAAKPAAKSASKRVARKK